MKVFVYANKKGSKKVREINNVTSVTEDKKNKTITFWTGEGTGEIINTVLFKTVTYQN